MITDRWICKCLHEQAMHVTDHNKKWVGSCTYLGCTCEIFEFDMKTDPINHPSHYTFGKIEVIDVIEDWKLPYHLSAAIKYIARAGKKEDEIQDLKKAVWYLNRWIEQKEKK